MRIGIVSDVHGNVAGLTAALTRMGEVDLLLCAGDMIEEYRFVNEAVALLRDRGAVCVLGNHDLGMLAPHGERARTADHVDPELVAWLASRPRSVELDVEGKKLVMTHASPCPPHTQYVLPHTPEMRRIADVDADYVVIGHSHVQMVERIGDVLLINPGSVGQARDHRNGKRLSYAVLDTETDTVTIDDYTIDNDTIDEPVPTGSSAQMGAR